MKKAEQLLQTSASPVQSLFTIFPFIYGNYYVYLKLKIDLLICLHLFFSLQVSTFPKAKTMKNRISLLKQVSVWKCMFWNITITRCFLEGARVGPGHGHWNYPQHFYHAISFKSFGRIWNRQMHNAIIRYDLSSVHSEIKIMEKKKLPHHQKHNNIPRGPFMNHSKWLHAFVMITRMCTYLKL